jgi:hypothetical protein
MRVIVFFIKAAVSALNGEEISMGSDGIISEHRS